MVRIGLVGIGFMGRIHYLASQGLAGAAVTAVCSRDPKKLAGDWSATRGNFGPEPGHVNLAGIKTYSRYEDLLADPDIDLIDICSPTDQHPAAAIAALRAGKHVLVEKAIALSTADADTMLDAASASGKLLMVAHVLPYFPEFAFAVDTAKQNTYGKLLGGHWQRVIAKPDWSAEIGDVNKTGGPAVDLHIHDTHFISLLCGVPEQVSSVGLVDPSGAVNYLTTQYLYGPGGPAVSCSSGAVAMPGRPFVHGYEIYFERATLTYSSAGIPLTVYTADGKTHQPTLSTDPIAAFTAELQAAADGVRTGSMPDVLSGRLARNALSLCFKECESVKTGRKIAV